MCIFRYLLQQSVHLGKCQIYPLLEDLFNFSPVCIFKCLKSVPAKCSSLKVSNLSKGGQWPLLEACATSSSGRWSCLERWGGKKKKMGRSNKKGWKFSLKVRQGVKNPLEEIMIYLYWSYIIIMGGKCTPCFVIRIHNRKVTNVLKDECKDWKPPHVFTQSASSYSPKVKVSIPILNVYWPGKICQFLISICQMISPMTSVRTPSSLEMGESGS